MTDNDRLIRTARLEDAECLAAIEAECFPAAEAAGPDSIARRLEIYPNHFRVLCIGGRPAAFVNGMVTDVPDLTDEMYDHAELHDEGGAWQMIFGVDTLPGYRRQGCAAALLNRMIADARKEGRRGLVLTCKEKLLHYYEKFGFVNEGISQSVHGNVRWYQMRLTFSDDTAVSRK